MYEYIISNILNYNFVFVSFVFSLIIISFILFFFKNDITFMFRMVFDNNHFFYYSGNKKKTGIYYLIPLLIIYIQCISFVTLYNIRYDPEFLSKFLFLSLFLILIFTFKTLLIFILINVFNKNFKRKVIIYNSFIHEASLGVFLFPFSYILYYVNNSLIIYTIIFIISIVIYVYKYYKLYKFFINKIKLFYSSIFLYLCCLEIIPFLWFLKIFVQNA